LLLGYSLLWISERAGEEENPDDGYETARNIQKELVFWIKE